jgi:DNA-binding MurR/RpiR family transcriptional regulator
LPEHSDIFARIRAQSGRMSKAQRRIAAYLEAHPDTVPFLTTAKLAKQARVGEATVVRFASALGFSGFTEMQQHLQEQLRRRVTTVERLDLNADLYPEEQRIAYEVLTDDIANLKQTMQMLDAETFSEAVKRIHQAASVTIVALRSSHSLGSFLAFYFQLLRKNTQFITDSDTMFEKLAHLNKEDLVIGISFSRYTARTVEAMRFVRERGVQTLAITDAHHSPLAAVSDLSLIASSSLPSFLDSFVAPLSLINALLTAVARMNRQEVTRHLERMERLWEQEGIYHSDEK